MSETKLHSLRVKAKAVDEDREAHCGDVEIEFGGTPIVAERVEITMTPHNLVRAKVDVLVRDVDVETTDHELTANLNGRRFRLVPIEEES